MTTCSPKDSLSAEDLLHSYAAINDSYRCRLVFKLTNSGLFSEINNLLLGILYCLDRQLRFTLSSSDFAVAPFEGWEDYFLPFCDEVRDPKLDFFNWRDLGKWKTLESYGRVTGLPLLWRLRFLLFNNVVRPLKYADTRLLTAEFGNIRRLRHCSTTHFEFAELGIAGGLLEALHQISAIVWRYKSEVGDEIGEIVSSLGLPNDYVGVHVRRGDKRDECSLFDEGKYLELIGSSERALDVFVLADDYLSLERIRILRPHWTLFTLTDPTEYGYDNRVFLSASPDYIRQKTVKLLAAVEVLTNAKHFVGMYKANLSSFVALRRSAKECNAVDARGWCMS